MTPARVRELLEYDPFSGVFVWRERSGARFAGMVAGCRDRHGYTRIRLDNVLYHAHRLAWAYAYGAWPPHMIDHINCDRHDNRICNLRAATPTQNAHNMSKSKANKSGFTGVSWDKAKQKWSADIGVKGKKRHLGRFRSVEDARDAYLAAKAKLHSLGQLITCDQNEIHHIPKRGF